VSYQAFATTLGGANPTWIRIGLVAVIALSMFANLGLGVPLAVIYLILLIVVPEANTSAEKLQMRGKTGQPSEY
jgi:phage shock protein PspC (stress-responsive transcriptional regulator)